MNVEAGQGSARSSGHVCRIVALLIAVLAAPATLAVAIESPPTKGGAPLYPGLATDTVPDVIGHRPDDAPKILQKQGSKAREVSEDGTSNRAGVVIRTAPAAHFQSPVAQRPELMVFHRAEVSQRADGPSTVPSILGNDCNGARRILAGANFTLSRCEPGAATHRYEPGAINQQEPGPKADASSNRHVIAWTEPQPDRGSVGAKLATGPQDAPSPWPKLTTGFATSPQQPGPITVPTGKGVETAPPNQPLGTHPEREPPVPSLIGLTCEEAGTLLKNRKLVLASCDRGKFDGVTRLGRINAQRPSPGSSPPADRNVQAWTTPLRVEVPNLSGQTADMARERLADSHLQAQFTGPKARLGARVRAQQPAAGTMVDEGTQVSLQMKWVVPDLEGRTCADASEVARTYGLNGAACVAVGGTGSGKAVGTVYAQEPRPGTALETPAEVTVQIVALPKHTPGDGSDHPVAKPDVTGATVVAAPPQPVRRPDAAGAPDPRRTVAAPPKPVREPDAAGAPDPRRIVAAPPKPVREPDAASTEALPKVELVEVPALTGKTCADARDIVQRLELRFTCNSRWPAATLLAPIVDTQRPPATTMVSVGTMVAGTATPNWQRAGGLLALLAGVPLLAPGSRRWIRQLLGPNTPPPLAPPTLALRGEPDRAPRISLRAADTRLDWPALDVRGEAGTPHCFVQLSNGEDDHGSA